MLTLRDYQHEAVEATIGAWRAGMRRPAVVLPTGAGKTVCFADLARRVAELGGRTAVLAHRDELISQAVNKLHAVAPGLRVGVYQAGRREVRGRDVVVGSLGSLTRAARRAEMAAGGFSAVVVDECHHATATTYRDALSAFGCFEPGGTTAGAVALGVTATMVRGDGVALGHVWEDVVYRREIVDMVRMGYLCTARGIRVRVAGLDLSRVRRAAGDFSAGALGEAMSDALAPAAIARAVTERASDRRGLVFVPSVAFAHETAEAMREAGLSAVAVDAKTPAEDRRLALKMFMSGDVRWLVNCGLFTEGTDLPMADCVVIARPTSSTGLYMQMAGRGLRPFPGKRDCLVIDVVGMTSKYKLASFAVLAGGELVETLSESEREELDRLAEELDLLGLAETASGGLAEEVERGHVGELEYDEVSLFDQSHQQWLRTRGGNWCLVAGPEVIALAPTGEPGRFNVCAMPLDKPGGRWVVEDVEMSYAMSWGEKECDRIEASLPFGVRKAAGWRKADPSIKQLNACHYARIVVPLGAKAGDVGDLLSIDKASRRLDHLPMFARS
jgi:superfamily II DNA or RNA helicase